MAEAKEIKKNNAGRRKRLLFLVKIHLFRAPLLPRGRKHAGFISFFVCLFEALIISLKMFLLFIATLQARVRLLQGEEK